MLDNANSIFKPKGRLPYYDYWNSRLRKIISYWPNTRMLTLVKFSRRYKNVVNHLDTFLQTITELNVLPIDTLKQQNYRPILNLIGVEMNSYWKKFWPSGS